MPDWNNYIAATIDKHQALAETPSPRILFVGGSNLTFGMDSPRLAAALGRPVLNLALHYELRLPFMLAEAAAAARVDDTVVISLEYEHYSDVRPACAAILPLLEFRPQSVQYVEWSAAPAVLDDAIMHVGAIVRNGVKQLVGVRVRGAGRPYSRGSFNREGDLVAHRALPRGPRGGEAHLPASWRPSEVDAIVAALNSFHASMKRRGVEVLYTHPPISEEALRVGATGLQALQDALNRRCTIPVLDSPRSSALPREMFYDTAYHLNGEGARRRVDRLVPLLRARLDGP